MPDNLQEDLYQRLAAASGQYLADYLGSTVDLFIPFADDGDQWNVPGVAP